MGGSNLELAFNDSVLRSKLIESQPHSSDFEKHPFEHNDAVVENFVVLAIKLNDSL